MRVGEERFNGDDIRRQYESTITLGAVAGRNQGEFAIDFDELVVADIATLQTIPTSAT